jgi:uncharacterized protein
VLPEYLQPLLAPDAYPHPVGAVRVIETHISWVILTGEFAYKVKRPVCYPFVDLRALARRALFCDQELRLGRRFAPELYLDVCRVAVRDGRTRIGGAGVVVEYAVRMRQFDGDDMLDRLLATGRVDVCELEKFGCDLASRQRSFPIASAPLEWGSPGRVCAQVLDNLAQCMQCAESLGTQAELRALSGPIRSMLRALDPWMTVRREQGRVREGHGDLHSRNVFRYQGRLIAFDCMEFEPAFRWIDVAEEVAFLVMDLHAQSAHLHAHAFLSGFLAQSGDYAACRLLPLYSIHRALVRAKVSALEAFGTTEAATRDAAVDRHRIFLNEARRQLAARPPMLVLMSGLSGSGKSWLASRLAPSLGAVHIRSDIERKRLAGLSELDQSGAGIGQGIYSQESNAALLAHLLQCAGDVLGGGYSVIVDATFGRRSDRERFRNLAATGHVDIRLIHCHAPARVLTARVLGRQHSRADASEADLAVLSWQELHREPITPEEGFSIVDADTTRDDIVAEVCQALHQ